MQDMNREEFGRALREAWLSVLCIVAISAVTVVAIFYGSKMSYQKEVERLEIQLREDTELKELSGTGR